MWRCLLVACVLVVVSAVPVFGAVGTAAAPAAAARSPLAAHQANSARQRVAARVHRAFVLVFGPKPSRACRLFTRAGQRRVVKIVKNADYPIRDNASCADATKRMRRALGARQESALIHSRMRGIQIRGRHASGKVFIKGFVAPQLATLRRVRGSWLISRLPGGTGDQPHEDRPAA
jgi:hypothetical protein